MKTEGGLRLHMNVFHKESAVKVREKPKVSPKTAVVKAKAKPPEVTVDTTEFAKKQRALYKAVKKKWPKKATNFVIGGKVKRSELTAIFPAETSITVVRSHSSRPLSKILEATYVVSTVVKHRGGWKTTSLRGKKTLVTWKEGEIGKSYRITYPTIAPL